MNQQKTGNRPDERIVRTTSAYDCGGRCPLRLHVKGNQILRVEGDDAPEPNQLRTCLRCRAYKQYVHHPDRFLYPQKRVGKRGEGKFERISWDEAYDTFIGQLDRIKATYGNSNKADKALKQLEFIAVSELFPTATARYADIIFPVTSAAERNDFTRPWPSGPYFTVINQAIKPLGECKSDLQIASELAERMGVEGFNPHSEEEWLKILFENNPEYTTHIDDYEAFRQKGIHRIELPESIVAFRDQIADLQNNPFPTPSGKIEIFSQRAADLDNPACPPIPKYLPTAEDRFDPLAEKYPLQLLTPHPRNRVHSELYLASACWHCAAPVCADACPPGAIYKRQDDGVVIVDPEKCLGKDDCGTKCLKACPYDAPQFGPEENARMHKCNFCEDRLAAGKVPNCVEACPVRALDAGPMEELEKKMPMPQTFQGSPRPEAIFEATLRVFTGKFSKGRSLKFQTV
ncbi:MAG: 4Fe-4S dicluster domain-containing protein [Desulfosalsimonas sp.]|uniref:4Fe-4S dicluster domain-containing protein n=1 Tax=Desulfosalsimonas sp. TaxID=3073848 RepID=UPI0039707549